MLFATSDLRNAFRSLMQVPAISASAILCLALGIGSTTAISSAIDRALIQPPPFRHPEQLVTVYRTTPRFRDGPFSVPNYLDVTHRTKQLSDVSAVSYGTALLNVGGDASQVSVLNVTGNLFPMLGVRAQYGRLLLPSDEARDQNKVVVLSDALWRRLFSGNPAIVNQTVDLDGAKVTVVGIAPRSFRIPRGGSVLTADLWLPLRFTDQQLAQRNSNFLPVIGRLAPGATPATADRELGRIFDDIVAIDASLKGEGIHVVPLTADASASVRTPLLQMFGAVVMVLLIAAINVAALLLARGVQRRRETAIRTALGGDRWAVMRPLVLESVLLATAGLVLGITLAWAGVRTIGALASQQLPQLAGLSIDPRVIAFAVVLAFAVALCCGVVPAWRTSTIDPQATLRDGRGGGMGRGQHRALSALVVAEVALSLVLLVGAGLVLKGFARLSSSDPGFDPAPILTLTATVPRQSYQGETAALARFLEPALAAVQQIPGVAAAANVQLLPYQNWGWNFNVRYEGQPADNPAQMPLVEVRTITPGFFDVTRQRVLRGRALRQSDDDRPESQAVVVINQTLADRDFKGQDPVGKRFYNGDTTFATIVGVVSNIRNVGPFAPPAAEMYFTERQQNNGFSSFPIMVRVKNGNPTAVAAAVQAAIRKVEPLAAVSNVVPMEQIMAVSVGQPRFYLMLLGTFALAAITLAVAGLYGVMSYVVAQRTRELGIRNALGSSAWRTVRLVTRQGMILVGAGIGFGLLGALAVTRLLVGMLYGVSPLDWLTWCGACAVLAASGLLAIVVPSSRAARIDPLTAIRAE